MSRHDADRSHVCLLNGDFEAGKSEKQKEKLISIDARTSCLGTLSNRPRQFLAGHFQLDAGLSMKVIFLPRIDMGEIFPFFVFYKLYFFSL